MKDHIEEYFTSTQGSREINASKELFKADAESIDLKTDLQPLEITMINILHFNNELLKSKGLKPAWELYIEKYMRLKVSLERKSRGEFVQVNRQTEDTEKTLDKMSNISNIMGAKK